MHSPILAPAVVLVLWSLVMLLWMVLTRMPALARLGVSLKTVVGGQGKDLDGVVPDNIQWKAHNYNHLMEQPTLFYAAVLVLAVAGAGAGVNLALAWVYVVLRVLHSLVQATFNRVAMRFGLFVLASLTLVALAVRAAMAVF